MATNHLEQLVQIPIDSIKLEGSLALPIQARGLVVFAHGSGSSRFSPRNNFVARVLREAGIGTLLMDLLTEEEDAVYQTRFNIDLLTERLLLATQVVARTAAHKRPGDWVFWSEHGSSCCTQSRSRRRF